MSGGEASLYLAFLGAYIVCFSGIAIVESKSKVPRITMALGVLCLLPGIARLWIAAVAG